MRDGRTWAARGLAGLALVTAAAALALTGGPWQARKEHRDGIRTSDMRAIATHVQCVVNVNGGTVPQTLEGRPGCNELPRLSDPFSGEPYLYEVLGPWLVRVCGTVELTPDQQRNVWYNDHMPDESPGTRAGCREYRIHQP